jgi:hypothetical protein
VLPDLTNSTAAQITEAHHLFAVQTSAFNACNQIERTIIQQISAALDDDSLADLINEDTGQIQGTVPETFLDSHRTFGAITPQTLAKAKADLEQTVYDHTKPLSNVFTAIARHADMASAAESEETTAQLINIGLIIITRPTTRTWKPRKRTRRQTRWPIKNLQTPRMLLDPRQLLPSRFRLQRQSRRPHRHRHLLQHARRQRAQVQLALKFGDPS